MSTRSDAFRFGDVHRGTSGDDFIFLNSRDDRMPVLDGGRGNDTLRGDGREIVIFGGLGDDDISVGANFGAKAVVHSWDPMPGKQHLYYGGPGRDTIESGDRSYINGKGTGDGNSHAAPQDADVFIFHQMGPRDYSGVTRVSAIDLGLDRAHLQSHTFTVTSVTGEDLRGGRFDVDHVVVRGPSVSKGGGGEWLDLDFDDRTPLIVPRGEDHKEWVHDALAADFFIL